MKLVWTNSALSDRQTIYDYIEDKNSRAALALDQRISDAAHRLVNHPESGRPGRVEGTLELVAHRNYIFIYDIDDKLVRILRVLHALQMWPP